METVETVETVETIRIDAGFRTQNSISENRIRSKVSTRRKIVETIRIDAGF